jgi:tRNA1(Val) A37 N6-methylase TrmN6
VLKRKTDLQAKLDFQHNMFFLTFDGKFFTAPIPEGQQLHRVLDAGTGTGVWAVDLGKTAVPGWETTSL